MDLAHYFRQLLNYDAWANRKVIESFREVTNPPKRSIRLLAHVIAAEHVWLSRLRGKQQPFPVWPEFTLEQCTEQVDEVAGLWWSYFDGLPVVLTESVTYKNSKGESWTSTVCDILTHVFMHSTYHRGQIATNMREHGYTPAYTDFIHAVRQGLLE